MGIVTHLDSLSDDELARELEVRFTGEPVTLEPEIFQELLNRLEGWIQDKEKVEAIVQVLHP